MSSVQQAKVVSLIVAVLYIGTGTIQLLNLIGGNGIFPLGEGFDTFFTPGYFLGFALGYGGGKFWAVAGQAVMFLIVYGITFSVFLPIFKIMEKKTTSSNDT
ncbi:hypothetical protein [uncultured Hymenobacter sp.]|uniref:hypothetical protein n=1 Tax=uncultured Hymenobacter sp. TaxID=170016 RepID=UPI0035CB27BE